MFSIHRKLFLDLKSKSLTHNPYRYLENPQYRSSILLEQEIFSHVEWLLWHMDKLKNHFLKSLLSSHFFLTLMLMLNFFVVYSTLFSSHHSNQPTLHKKWSFPLRISSFLCSVNIKIRQAMTPFHRISVGMTNCWFCSNNFVQIMMKNIRLLWSLRFVFFLSLPPSVYKSIWNGIFYGP